MGNHVDTLRDRQLLPSQQIIESWRVVPGASTGNIPADGFTAQIIASRGCSNEFQNSAISALYFNCFVLAANNSWTESALMSKISRWVFRAGIIGSPLSARAAFCSAAPVWKYNFQVTLSTEWRDEGDCTLMTCRLQFFCCLSDGSNYGWMRHAYSVSFQDTNGQSTAS